MKPPTTKAVADSLRELGRRMEMQGGNPYRARAYRRAAENLLLSPLPLPQLIADGRLTEVPGVGDALAAVITEIYETGTSSRLTEMRQDTPMGVLEMLTVPGLRPDKVRKLHKELGIASLADLEDAARSGKLAATKGYGPAFQAKVLQGLEILSGPQGRHLHRAAAAFEYAAKALGQKEENWTNITPAGEFRRGCELVSALSLVTVNPKLSGADEQTTLGEELIIHVTRPERYGIALLLATGSTEHITTLKKVARRKGMDLQPSGLMKDGRVVASRTEAEIYKALGLPFIAPELRETGEEVQLALEGGLPELIVQKDLHGVLHAHTNESDGSDSLHDMAEASRRRGYMYLGLTDHSQTAHYAGGLKIDEVAAQQRAIDRLNSRYGPKFHIFKGIESDILSDGALDYPDEVLASFDLIIASVHSKFRMSRQDQTARIIKAVENPYTTILGHVSGRQLLRRPSYEIDMEQILRACAKHGVAIEINAHPWRLDMDWRWCKRGVELGCMFCIDPDAHSTDEIDNVRWGVLMARKGALSKDRVLNTLDLHGFQKYVYERKRQRVARRKPSRKHSSTK